jgi:predicted ribosomally synthesized peptide with SipW-like signal peptide
MASGIYNRLSLTGGTTTALLSNTAVATNKITVCTLNLTNRTTDTINVSLAISTNPDAAAANTDFIEYTFPLSAYGVLERTGVIVTRGLGVSALASANGITAIAYGIEN